MACRLTNERATNSVQRRSMDEALGSVHLGSALFIALTPVRDPASGPHSPLGSKSTHCKLAELAAKALQKKTEWHPQVRRLRTKDRLVTLLEGFECVL